MASPIALIAKVRGVRSLSWEQVIGWRLRRSHLVAPVADETGEANVVGRVVGDIAGVQAQIMSAAGLAIGIRVAGVTQVDVRAEVWQHRSLVKTYGPRGTLHLLPAAELPLWMAAMRACSSPSQARVYTYHGIEPPQLAAVTDAIGDALDGRCLTRQELADEVVQRVGEWARERLLSAWGDLLRPAATTGLLCFGPSQGAKITFVRADQWLQGWRDVDPDEAIAEVAKRYLAAYGPATKQDFAGWFGIEPDAAAGLFAASDLVEVDVEGARRWLLAEHADGPWEPPRGSLRLLGQYECYLLGSYPRARVVPMESRARITTYGRGRFEGAVALSVLLVDGVVKGIWRRQRRGNRIDLRVEPFIELSADQSDQLASEAARVGEFLGTDVALSVGALD
ncbi:winged helix DNA-binding domain-containing protein [soil metagenome]